MRIVKIGILFPYGNYNNVLYTDVTISHKEKNCIKLSYIDSEMLSKGKIAHGVFDLHMWKYVPILKRLLIY